MRWALIQTEVPEGEYEQGMYGLTFCTKPCLIFRGEYDTLEEAKAEQEKIELKSIIIQTF